MDLTLRKIAIWLSKNCQKLDIFFKKIVKNCHFLSIFLKKCQDIWQFFDIQLAIFRRFRFSDTFLFVNFSVGRGCDQGCTSGLQGEESATEEQEICCKLNTCRILRYLLFGLEAINISITYRHRPLYTQNNQIENLGSCDGLHVFR